MSRRLWLWCGIGGVLLFLVSTYCLYFLGVKSRLLALFISPPFMALGLVLTPEEPMFAFFLLSCAIGLVYGFLVGAVVGAAIQLVLPRG